MRWPARGHLQIVDGDNVVTELDLNDPSTLARRSGRTDATVLLQTQARLIPSQLTAQATAPASRLSLRNGSPVLSAQQCLFAYVWTV